MYKISLERLYETCDVLINDEDATSNFIQIYDPFLLEDDRGNVVKEFSDLEEEISITNLGKVIIDGTQYTPYNYKEVSLNDLIN